MDIHQLDATGGRIFDTVRIGHSYRSDIEAEIVVFNLANVDDDSGIVAQVEMTAAQARAVATQLLAKADSVDFDNAPIRA